MDSVSNGPVESSAESPAPAAEAVPKSSPGAAATKGRGLRRWRRIRREQGHHREGYAASAAAAAAGGGGRAGYEDLAQLHKHRLPLAAGAPKAKHEAPGVEAESSTASVESRFVPLAKLDPDLGLLMAPAAFSVGTGGAESDNSEGRSSKSSTAASAPRGFPRHDHALLLQRERDRVSTRPRAPGGASLHGRNPRADRPRVAYSAAVSADSRSSVESDLRSSNAFKAWQLGAGLNGVHKVCSDYCDHSDEEQPSDEDQSTGYCKDNVSSVMGRSVQRSADPGDGAEDTFDEASVGKGHNGNGRMHSGADYNHESILSLLQRTQEALENEIEKIMAIGKEANDDFDGHDDEWSGSDHLEEPIEEVSERIKHLESRLEASALITEKASRIHELEATTIENTNNLLLPHSDLDQLYQEKMEAEIRCAILTRAYQVSLTMLRKEQTALYEAQKSLLEDYKQLALKLRHTENRAMVLEAMAEDLQVQCKELSNSSEVLQLQSKASRVSLFCLVQFILLCIAIGTYLMRLSPSSIEVVPT